jgi:hypothetical protein
MAGRKRGTAVAVPQGKDPRSRSSRSAGATTTPESQESAPLSNPYVAVPVPGASVVREPEGSALLSLQRRSSRLAASREPPKLLSPHAIFSKTAPDGKRKPGWQYQVDVESVNVPSEAPGVSGGQLESVDGPRDVDVRQVGSKTRMVNSSSGRKRSATSDAPGDAFRGKASSRVASVSDFPPDHWVEPMSDDRALLNSPPSAINSQRSTAQSAKAPIPSHSLPSPMKSSPAKGSPMKDPSSPMKVITRDVHFAEAPSSSPLSHNPLLAKAARNAAPTPLGAHARDSHNRQAENARWFRAHDLNPPDHDFHTRGYVPVAEQRAARDVHTPNAYLHHDQNPLPQTPASAVHQTAPPHALPAFHNPATNSELHAPRALPTLLNPAFGSEPHARDTLRFGEHSKYHVPACVTYRLPSSQICTLRHTTSRLLRLMIDLSLLRLLPLQMTSLPLLPLPFLSMNPPSIPMSSRQQLPPL